MEWKRVITILIILFGSIFSKVFSQNTFWITIKDSLSDNVIYNGIQMYDGNYLLLNINYTPYSNPSIIKLNSQGQIIVTKNILKGDTCGLDYIIRISPNLYLLSGWIKQGGKNFLWLYEIDSALNEIRNKTYPLLNYNYSNSKVTIDKDNNIFCHGTVSDTVHNYPEFAFVYKISPDLEPLKLKVYVDKWAWGQDFLVNESVNEYLFFVLGYGLGGIGRILTLSSNLDIIEVNDIPHDVSNLNTTKWLEKDIFILSGEKRPGSPDEKNYINLLIADTSLKTLHNNIVGKPDTANFPGFKRNLDFTNVNSIYIGGWANADYNEFSKTDSWFSLYNVDTTLTLNWEKYYGGDAYYTLYSVCATSDGGCLMAGSMWDYHDISSYVRYPVIIKVDRDGLLYTEEGKTDPRVRKLILYPNPGSDRILIQTAVIHGALSFFDLTGRCVFQKEIRPPLETIDAAVFPSGIYFYRFIHSGKVIESGKWIRK